MRIACVGRYAHGLILAGLAAAAITLAPQPGQALTINELPDYDDTFPGLCAGDGSDNTACEQAVPEVRAGSAFDNSLSEKEIGIGRTTSNPEQTADYDWVDDNTGHDFTLSYDENTLTFQVEQTIVSFDVDLSPSRTMFIRARGEDGLTTLSEMSLVSGSDNFFIGGLSGDEDPDYLELTDFDWGSNWSLTGEIFLADGTSGDPATRSQSAAQFKLTNLGDTVDTTGISEPATLAIIGAGLLGAGLLRRRRSR
jgi:hypothetical protein